MQMIQLNESGWAKSFLIFEKNSGKAAIIDPVYDFVNDYLTKIDTMGLKLEMCIATHTHADHITGCFTIAESTGCDYVMWHSTASLGVTKYVSEESELTLGDEKITFYHVPGHTSGHICFYFYKEKIIFTGDTLFSLGCGRVFEGTHKQMFDSLRKLKNLPLDTKIYCGHEYTLQNSKFCEAQDGKNLKLKNKISEIKKRLEKGLPSVPTVLSDEIECNIFLKAKDVNSFSKLRDLKDNF